MGTEEEFAKKMKNCFENWNNLEINNPGKPLGDEVLALIKYIVNTVGENGWADKKVTGRVDLANYIMDNYHPVPYHNICHGIMVASYTDKLAENIDLDLEMRKAMIFGALLHDIGHTGVGNPYCRSTISEEIFPGLKFSKLCMLIPNKEEGKCNFDTEHDLPVPTFSNLITYSGNNKEEKYVGLSEEIKSLFLEYATPRYVDNANLKWTNDFCNTAEIQHAIVTNELLKKIGGAIETPPFTIFRKRAVMAVALTNMRPYNFENGKLDYDFKYTEEKNLQMLELVHFADILGMGEANEHLRFRMLKNLLMEMNGELYIKALQEKIDKIYKVWHIQDNFRKNFVEKQVSRNTQNPNLKNVFFEKCMQNIQAQNLVDTTNIPKTSNEYEKELNKQVGLYDKLFDNEIRTLF